MTLMIAMVVAMAIMIAAEVMMIVMIAMVVTVTTVMLITSVITGVSSCAKGARAVHPEGLRQKQSNQPVLGYKFYVISSFSTP